MLRVFLRGLPEPVLGFNCVGGNAASIVLKFLRQGGTVMTNGGNLEKAVNKARRISKRANKFHPEVLDAVENKCDESVMEKVLDLALAVRSSLNAMANEYAVSQAMSEYQNILRHHFLIWSSYQYQHIQRYGTS